MVDYSAQAQINTYTLTNTLNAYPSHFSFVEGARAAIVPIKSTGEIVAFKVDEVPCHPTCLSCGLDTSDKGCTSCSPPLVVKDDGSCDCPDGSFLTGSFCSLCSSNCLTCKEDSKKCSSCLNNFTLDFGGSGRCIPDSLVLKLEETKFFSNYLIIEATFSVKIHLD